MEFEGICLNCFSHRGEYDVCPYCGYVAGTPPREAYLLYPGVRLWGRYIIGTVLGIGGFGVTYKAWDTRLGTLVAIKEFYPPSLVSRIPGETKVRVFSGDRQEAYAQQLARFIDEAKNMAKFTGNAHIVNVLDYFEDNNTAYIVMEYLDGVTLKEFMAQQGGRLASQQAMVFTQGLLQALQSIHNKGVIHRDISPDNVFVLRNGGLKVLDFGAARFVARESSELTQGIVVKKGYAPPEQYRSNMKQGVWTDIYATGATLYKMLTGITPEESIERYEKDTLARPSQTGTVKDAELDRVIMKAMALRPEIRFKSAQEMMDALQNKTSIAFPEEELKKRQRAKGVVIGLSVAAALALAVLIGWQASRPPEVLLTGPTLADFDIQPDTITLMMWESDAAAEAMPQLVEAFEEQFPEHQVILEMPEYDEVLNEQLSTRMLTSGAPTVFPAYYSSLDQDQNPYMADLSPLYSALDVRDLYLMRDYVDDYETGPDEEPEPILEMPIGFVADVMYANASAAAQRPYTLPQQMPSYQELVDLEVQFPGSVEIDPWNFGDVLGALEPQMREERDLVALENRFVEYAELYQSGHFSRRYVGNLQRFDDPVYRFGYSSTRELRDLRQYSPGQYTVYPLAAEGSAQRGDAFSVSSYASENQQWVGMLFLRFMLSERGQSILHVQNDGDVPLNKKALAQYVAANPDFAFMTPEWVENLEWYGRSYYAGEFSNILNDLDEDIQTALEVASKLEDDPEYNPYEDSYYDGNYTEPQLLTEEEVRQMVREQYDYWLEDT